MLSGRIVLTGICCVLILSACANPFADDMPGFDQLLSGGWLSPDEAAAAPPEPLYCYETIAEEDCHDRPLEGEGQRLVGYEGPPPPLRIDP